MIVEYKLEKVRARSDAKKTPIWIDDGGYWYNSINHTYVGYIRDAVEYYVPSSLKELTRDSFISRMQTIHATHPLYKATADEETGVLDIDAELVAYTDEELITAMGSWWDSFTADK